MTYWCVEYYYPDLGLSTRQQHTGEVILRIVTSLCPALHYEFINTEKKRMAPITQIVNGKEIRQLY